jgi:hypothetical protein
MAMKQIHLFGLIAVLMAISACTQQAAPKPEPIAWEPLVDNEAKFQAARQKCLEVPMSEMAADPWCNAVNRATDARNKKMTRTKY